MSYGIRIRRKGGAWQRGKQFKRSRRSGGVWVFWRDEWKLKAAARMRLAAYRRAGFEGHVFEIKAPALKPVAYPTSTHYSPNFTRAELQCKGPECAGKRPPAAIERELTLLARDLERLRDELGTGLAILSGYRCPVHNKRVGGASQSQHMTGKAADLSVIAGQQDRYVAAAKRVPAFNHGGIGVYSNGGVHVDRRGWVARWNSWVRS